ncbi:MAG: hypothetical protein R2839_09120 [Thermomicrobiales bacterium]
MTTTASWGRSFGLLCIAIAVTATGMGATYLAREGKNPFESAEARAGLVYCLTLLAVWMSFRIGGFHGDPVCCPLPDSWAVSVWSWPSVSSLICRMCARSAPRSETGNSGISSRDSC